MLPVGGPPKRRFRFVLCESVSSEEILFSLSVDVGWWLEGIVAEAHKVLCSKLKITEATILPCDEMLQMWSNHRGNEDGKGKSKDED